MSDSQTTINMYGVIRKIEEKFDKDNPALIDYHDEWKLVTMYLDQLNDEIDELQRDKESLQDDISDLEDDIEFAHNKIDDLKQQLEEGES